MSDNSVKRYDLDFVGSPYHDEKALVENEHGEYIEYDDHTKAIESLQSEVEALKKELHPLQEMFNYMEDCHQKISVGYSGVRGSILGSSDLEKLGIIAEFLRYWESERGKINGGE